MENKMKNIKFFIGVDISAEYITVSALSKKDGKAETFENFENSANGFQSLLAEFQSHKITAKNSIVCMEATGVYGESLSYFLVGKKFRVAIENPYKIKRAFDISPKKTDRIDSKRIAEYGLRFLDELTFWSPRTEILEEIRIFLGQREQITKQKISLNNALKSLQKKFHQSGKAIKLYEEMIESCSTKLKYIDKEIQLLINSEPEYRQIIENLKTVPGVGNMLAVHMMVVTEGFESHLNAKEIGSYLGIVPLPYESGKSVRRRTSSSGVGPSIVRKLLYLSSMTSRRYDENMRKYFFRKVAEGKSKRLVLNNIANKLIKILIALIISKKPYIKNFLSINPMLLKKIDKKST